MQDKRKKYQFTLRTMAPLHIGSGDYYSAKEYIYENKEYYFPDMGQLYQVLDKYGEKVLKTFEDFLQQSGNYNNKPNPGLIEFLKDQRIKDRDFGGYKIKETGFEQVKGDRQGALNEVHSFMKDPYGNPYIPGSSLKGAIRTILVNQEPRFKAMGDKAIPWGANGRQPFDDIFHHIRVSDSEIIPSSQLMLAQKCDYNGHKDRFNHLSIHRESLKAFTAVKFEIDAVGDEAIRLIDQLPALSQKHYQAYYEKFLTEFPERYIQKNILLPNTQKNIFHPIYLGAGSGFWTKTELTKADIQKMNKRGENKVTGKGVLKLTKAPKITYKLKDVPYPLIQNQENLYEMGKCGFLLKEIQ